MCLAVPGQIESIVNNDFIKTGMVNFGGISKEVVLAYVPEAAVGDYIIVHAGFAISIINQAEADRVFLYIDMIEK